MPNEVIISVEAMASANSGNNTFDMTWGCKAPEETVDAMMGGEDDFIPAPTGVNAPQQIQHAQQIAGAMHGPNPFAPLYMKDDEAKQDGMKPQEWGTLSPTRVKPQECGTRVKSQE
jgi:hypothetical protein